VLFLVHRFLSPWWRRRQVPPKRRFLQGPHGVTTQKTPFFFLLCFQNRTWSKVPSPGCHTSQCNHQKRAIVGRGTSVVAIQLYLVALTNPACVLEVPAFLLGTSVLVLLRSSLCSWPKWYRRDCADDARGAPGTETLGPYPMLLGARGSAWLIRDLFRKWRCKRSLHCGCVPPLRSCMAGTTWRLLLGTS
jgi:hypothetical protein